MTESALNTQANEGHQEIPGEVGIWVFVLGDMFVFGLFFTVFVYYRGLDLEVFRTSQATLNQNYGALNTLLLLFSSWFVVLAVIDVREHAARYAARLLGLAMLCGLGFSVVKFVEYGEKLRAGLGIMTNDFYMYYYIFTGLHFVHVIIGLGVLIYLWSMVQAGVKSAGELRIFESGAIYWHMVDLLWIVLFPLLYLLQ
ncbi:MAG: cytochrome c oxidase subunit 3 [Gammaproteobacteria bacterium]